jgi:hypothetical protein
MLDIVATSVIALYLNQVSVTEIKTIEEALNPREKQELLKVCDREDSKDYERCKLRQLARTKVVGGKSKPLGAYDLYEKQDWSMGRLRDRLQAEMRSANQARVAKRRTYRQFEPIDNHNTQSRPYINEFKTEELRCMTEVPHGRPRNLCLDALRNKVRKEMRSTSGSMKIIAPEEEQE